MADRRVRRELLEKLNISRQALSQRAKRIKEKYGPMTTDEAVYVIAHQEHVDLSKYLPLGTIDRVRSLVPRDTAAQLLPTATKQYSKAPRRRQLDDIYFDPFIDDQIANAALKNAEIYPIVYVFENSVRKLVAAVMQKEFGRDWWETQVNDKIKNTVEIRRNEEKGHPWHSQRGAESIYYTDISDLKTIINTHNRVFTKLFGKIPRIELWIEEIEKTRNTLAHNNPVAKKDRERLNVYARDWSAFAKSAFDQLR